MDDQEAAERAYITRVKEQAAAQHQRDIDGERDTVRGLLQAAVMMFQRSEEATEICEQGGYWISATPEGTIDIFTYPALEYIDTYYVV